MAERQETGSEAAGSSGMGPVPKAWLALAGWLGASRLEIKIALIKE